VADAGDDDRPAAVAAALAARNPQLKLSREEIARSLDAENFVKVRRVTGGPAPEVAAEALSRAREEQAQIEEWIRSKQQALEAARAENIGG
jgi:argininosuccinate lyase